MRIAFIHPDLGIGGAERLFLDAAVGLQALGHAITIYTSYRDVNHCFDEARNGSLDVRVRGDTIIPAAFFGRFSILCAMLRQLHLALSILLSKETYDAVFIDQLSICIPLLQYFRPEMRILFYCHFPDKLLSDRTSFAKKIYRVPFDFLEGWTTGQADSIVVNSKYTSSIFHDAFPGISKSPKVIYPCVDIHQKFSALSVDVETRRVALSVNRFERKKNVALAVEAFALLKEHANFSQAVLVVAGGFDRRVSENVLYHQALQKICQHHKLTHATIEAPWHLPLSVDPTINVCFLLSIPSELKSSLLSCSKALLYTPENEHFGIVPIEASLAELPVIAQDNGGPLETVQDAVSGYLRPADPKEWSVVLRSLLFELSDAQRAQMGKKGRTHVLQHFSQETMSKAISDELHSIKKEVPRRTYTFQMLVLAVFLVGLWRSALSG